MLKKLFGTDPHKLVTRADAQLEQGDFGGAKLTYERALGGLDEADRTSVQSKINTCRNGIARTRLDEAKRLAAQGALDLAHDEIAGALEVAVDPAIEAEAQALVDGFERDEAVAQAQVTTMSDEEQLALIMGQWEAEQADEYDGYGRTFDEAILAMHQERAGDALRALEVITQEAAAPVYLWLEVGRARLLNDDLEGGADALRTFLNALPDKQGGEARLSAHMELARLASERDDFEGAMAEFEHAVQSMPDDFRPYFAMGVFLRAHEHPTEALDVLKSAKTLAQAQTTDWRLLQELGLALRDNAQPKEAITELQGVIDFFTQYQEFDYPVTTAVPLAELYAANGQLERAADLYRALCKGSNGDNHAEYHRRAGVALGALGLSEEAHRMLTRAQALAQADPQLLESIDKALQSLTN